MSLFRQPNVTLVTWGRCGSEDFLVAWVLLRRHTTPRDWLSLAESLKENYKYTTSNKISMSSLFISVCLTDSTGIVFFFLPFSFFSFPIHIAHALCTCVQTHRSNTISIHPQNNFSCPFSYIKIVSKVKRPFIGAATSLDTRWCHKSRKAWKSKTSIWTKRGKQ